MSRRLPHFVVAGAARAGSTAIAESLRRHPGVFVTQPKEPHYLALAGRGASFTGPDDETTINRVAVTDRAAYLSLFPGEGEHLVMGEGSVSTMYYHDDAVPRLQQMNPDVRVVLVLREPVSRAYSSHQYLLNRGSEPLPDFLNAVGEEESRKRDGWHHLWHYTAMSRYADAVAHLYSAFGPDRVRVWWYDELTGDPVRCLTEVHEFVGVRAPAPADLTVDRVNSSGRARSGLLQAAMQGASRSAGLRTAVKRVVPFDVRERIRNSNLAKQDVPSQVRRAIAPLFVDDLARLEAVIGRPVPATWRLVP